MPSQWSCSRHGDSWDLTGPENNRPKYGVQRSRFGSRERSRSTAAAGLSWPSSTALTALLTGISTFFFFARRETSFAERTPSATWPRRERISGSGLPRASSRPTRRGGGQVPGGGGGRAPAPGGAPQG